MLTSQCKVDIVIRASAHNNCIYNLLAYNDKEQGPESLEDGYFDVKYLEVEKKLQNRQYLVDYD